MAAVWEETKRTAQSVFNGIGNAYQQVLLSGHLYPSQGNSDLNREIAEDAYQVNPEYTHMERAYAAQEQAAIEPQQDIEPER